MAITIDSFTTSSASRPVEKPDMGVAIHEIANSDGSYVQTTGKLTPIYEYELLLEEADKNTLVALATSATRVFSDDVLGKSMNAKLEIMQMAEVGPRTWRIGIRLVKVAF